MQNKKSILLLLLLVVTMTIPAVGQERLHCSQDRHPKHVTMRSSRASEHTMSRRTEYSGEKHQLVFVVDFSDLYFQDADPATLWKKVFNQKNFQEPPFHGSVRDYFYEQSFEQFELVFDVYYVHMDKNHAEYRSGDIDFYDDTRSGLLLTEILDIKKEEIPDWSIYDWDDDGYINQVVILFAGKGQNDGGDETTIWSHQWWLSSQSEAPYYREWGHPYPVSSGGKEFKVVGLLSYVNYLTLHESNTDMMFDAFGFDVAMVTPEAFDELCARLHYNYAFMYEVEPSDKIEKAMRELAEF